MGNEFGLSQVVQGVGPSGRAYRLSSRAQLTLAASDLFDSSLANQFSFGCLFRQPNQNNRAWNLVKINDLHGTPQFSVIFRPNEDTIQVELPTDVPDDNVQVDGYYKTYSQSQTIYFKNVHYKLNKNSWNKLRVSIYPTNVTLYLNCNKILTQPVKPVRFNTLDDVWIAQYDDDFTTVPVSCWCCCC